MADALKEEYRKRTIRVISQQSGVAEEDIKITDSFELELGMDSLDRMELLIDLEGEFMIDVIDEDWENVTGVQETIDLVFKYLNFK